MPNIGSVIKIFSLILFLVSFSFYNVYSDLVFCSFLFLLFSAPETREPAPGRYAEKRRKERKWESFNRISVASLKPGNRRPPVILILILLILISQLYFSQIYSTYFFPAGRLILRHRPAGRRFPGFQRRGEKFVRKRKKRAGNELPVPWTFPLHAKKDGE